MKIAEISDTLIANPNSTNNPPSPVHEESIEWYVQNIQYACSFYNKPLFTNGRLAFLPDNNGKDLGANNGANGDGFEYVLPVQDMVNNLLYYYGRQPNFNYSYLTQNVTKPNIQAAWIKGQKISRLVDFLANNMKAMISNGSWEAENMSPRAKGKKSEMLERLQLEMDMRPFFEDLAKMGVQSMAANGQQFDFPEEIYRYMETDYKEQTGDIMTLLADGLWQRGGWSYKAHQAAMYMVCTNIACAEHKAQNGIHQWEHFPSTQLIWDIRKDDDYNRYGMFRGRITATSSAEVIRKYPWKPEQIEEIKLMAASSDLGKPLNVLPNFTWWNYNASYNSITEATVYFKAISTIKRGKKKNKYGNEMMADLDEGGYEVMDIYKGTIVGGKWLVDYGPITNLVENRDNCGMPEFPISIFCPNMMLSQYRSAVSRLRDLQDEIDALKFKVREMVGRAKGKAYIIKGNKLTGNIDVQEIEEDFASLGITVVNSSGEVGQGDQKISEGVDMTLDPNIQRIWELAALEATEMEEIVSASKSALGQQSRYIGQATQQQNINQSSIGMAYLIDGFMDWLQRNMQYAVDMQKELIAAGKCKISEFWVGDRNQEFLKLIKGVRTESFLMALNINDPMNEQDKKEIITTVQAFIQNQMLDPVDYFKLKTLKTKSEMLDYLEYARKQRERKQAKQAAAAAEQERAMQEAELENQQVLADKRATTDTELQKNEIYSDTVMQTLKLKESGKGKGVTA